jgi:hypothetical protein
VVFWRDAWPDLWSRVDVSSQKLHDLAFQARLRWRPQPACWLALIPLLLPEDCVVLGNTFLNAGWAVNASRSVHGIIRAWAHQVWHHMPTTRRRAASIILVTECFRCVHLQKVVEGRSGGEQGEQGVLSVQTACTWLAAAACRSTPQLRS